mmetsp:Transcript_1063/g.1951  ORF Transcript_1063/g.1951 Transcript_1063/m.1951 type:complete len:128 (+) Transcript_1063:846-1229(+)
MLNLRIAMLMFASVSILPSRCVSGTSTRFREPHPTPEFREFFGSDTSPERPEDKPSPSDKLRMQLKGQDPSPSGISPQERKKSPLARNLLLRRHNPVLMSPDPMRNLRPSYGMVHVYHIYSSDDDSE